MILNPFGNKFIFMELKTIISSISSNLNNKIYVERLQNLFSIIEEDYQKRLKFKSIYKFVLTIEELEELEKINNVNNES